MDSLPNSGAANIFCEGPAGKIEVAMNILSWDSVCIICHPHPLYQGTMHNKVVTTIAKGFENQSVSTVRFNFRGVGKSEGEYADGVGEVEDALAIYEMVKAKNPSKIYLAGFSFGSYIAAKIAQKKGCEHLLMVGSAVIGTYFKDVDEIPVPITIIHGDQDEVVPIDLVEKWVEKLQAEKTFIIMKDASHFFHGRLIELRDLIEEKCFPR